MDLWICGFVDLLNIVRGLNAKVSMVSLISLFCIRWLRD